MHAPEVCLACSRIERMCIEGMCIERMHIESMHIEDIRIEGMPRSCARRTRARGGRGRPHPGAARAQNSQRRLRLVVRPGIERARITFSVPGTIAPSSASVMPNSSNTLLTFSPTTQRSAKR